MSIDVLQEKIRVLKNPTMLGLDPTPDVMPEHLLQESRTALGISPEAVANAYVRFCCELLDGLKDLIPGVKVQRACFDVLGAPGVAAMQEVLQYAGKLGYYVLLDSMWGDVGRSAELYASSVFGTVEMAGPGCQVYPCDAVTLNAYLGSDGVKPFLPYCRDAGKSLFVFVKTSNRSSVEVQDLLSGGRLVYTAMADLVSRWGTALYGKSGYSQVAAVVGATYPEALRSLRAKYDRMFFLVPGYGAQGGSAKSAQCAFDRFGHGAAVCAARSILGAWKRAGTDGSDYVACAVGAAEKMKKDFGKYVTIM